MRKFSMFLAACVLTAFVVDTAQADHRSRSNCRVYSRPTYGGHDHHHHHHSHGGVYRSYGGFGGYGGYIGGHNVYRSFGSPYGYHQNFGPGCSPYGSRFGYNNSGFGLYFRF